MRRWPLDRLARHDQSIVRATTRPPRERSQRTARRSYARGSVPCIPFRIVERAGHSLQSTARWHRIYADMSSLDRLLQRRGAPATCLANGDEALVGSCATNVGRDATHEQYKRGYSSRALRSVAIADMSFLFGIGIFRPAPSAPCPGIHRSASRPELAVSRHLRLCSELVFSALCALFSALARCALSPSRAVLGSAFSAPPGMPVCERFISASGTWARTWRRYVSSCRSVFLPWKAGMSCSEPCDSMPCSADGLGREVVRAQVRELAYLHDEPID